MVVNEKEEILTDEEKFMLRKARQEEKEIFALAEKILGKEEVNKIAFVTFIINEFAEAYKMNRQEGYCYLKLYGGIDFLHNHWWALHTDNPYYAVRDIFDVCKNNGGYLL